MANKLSKLRELNSDFSRAYKYLFRITATPGSALQTLTERTVLDPDALSAACLNIVMPGEGVQLIEVEVGRHTLKLNGRKEKTGVINPEFILSGDYKIYKFFRAWQKLASPDHHTDTINNAGSIPIIAGESQQFNKNILATIQITAFDVSNTSSLVVELENVWCRNAPEINFADDTNDIIRWAPELVYEFSRIVTP